MLEVVDSHDVHKTPAAEFGVVMMFFEREDSHFQHSETYPKTRLFTLEVVQLGSVIDERGIVRDWCRPP